MPTTLWVKACECRVTGCVLGHVMVALEKGPKVTTLLGVMEPEPACPNCHKPWRKEERPA